MTYFSLARRVPEASAVEPKALTWLYWLTTQMPCVRTAHHHFVKGALAQGVETGYALDLGTGPGYVARVVARRRPALRMVGLDLALHMVERARRQARQTGLDGGQLWPQADGHRLPFADGTFDLVISSYALHHWLDPLRVFNEIARVLKPGGRYYVGDVCREVDVVQRLFAYGSIPVVSLAFGSYRGYGGYYESVRAGYTRDEAWALLERSDLPPGEVGLDSTWFLPVLTIASRGGG
jgi:ubiquinone/menaquinone biosynthesis C-methylase UbiE